METKNKQELDRAHLEVLFVLIQPLIACRQTQKPITSSDAAAILHKWDAAREIPQHLLDEGATDIKENIKINKSTKEVSVELMHEIHRLLKNATENNYQLFLEYNNRLGKKVENRTTEMYQDENCDLLSIVFTIEQLLKEQ